MNIKFNIKMNINTKMLIFILATTILIFALSVGYTTYKTRQLAIKNAEKLVATTTKENAVKIEEALSNDLSVLRTLAEAFSVYDGMDESEWKPLFLKMYYKVYAKNPNFYKLWDSWELNQFDTTWTKDYGRYAVTVFRKNDKIEHSESIRSQDGDNELYGKIKSISKNMLWEPYWDAFVEKEEVKKFMTSLSAPIIKGNKFAGIVAADIIMDRFQQLIDEIKPYKSTVAFLVSNQGTIVGHTNSKLTGKPLMDYASSYEEQFGISLKIKDGISGVFNATNKLNQKVLVALAPIQVGDYKAPWSLVIEVPNKVILKEINSSLNWSLILALLGIIIITVVVYFVTTKMSQALVKTTGVLKQLSIGDIEGVDDLIFNRGDEVDQMAESVNSLREGLKKTSVFAEHIGRGDLEASFNPLSNKDTLGTALLNMRESLKHAETEEKKRKIEDEKLNWANQGLAKFGEILRTNSNSIKNLAFSVMSNLINYLEINQGAIFIIDDTDDGKYLELKSAIAYGRDKFMNKRVAVGEELIGRCAYEKRTIYMTDIPKNYIKITSGLGTANPSALLLVPLVLNEEIYGVIELASFNAIESYQIEFVEKLGESIASTIANVKVNEKTSHLLDQSKTQAEELAAQEEEMRQNLEELQATQEEAARREYETAGIVKALGSAAFIVEYDLEGTILSCNEKYAKMLGMPQEKIIGQSHQSGYDFTSEMKANYDLFWGDLRRGIQKKEINKVNFNNREFWVEETYTPIINQSDDKTYKILKIGFDITDQKKKEQQMQEQEIKIRKERLLLGEYQGRLKELQEKFEQAKQKISDLENNPPAPAIETPEKEIPLTEEITASGNNLIDWVENMKIGIGEIDEQHEQLVTLINNAFQSINENKTKKEIKENIRSFIDFASYHFGNEEQYFDQFGYAAADDHTTEHQQFLKELKQLQTDYNSNKTKSFDAHMNRIKQWLFNHFTTVDVKFVDLFKSNGLT